MLIYETMLRVFRACRNELKVQGYLYLLWQLTIIKLKKKVFKPKKIHGF